MPAVLQKKKEQRLIYNPNICIEKVILVWKLATLPKSCDIVAPKARARLKKTTFEPKLPLSGTNAANFEDLKVLESDCCCNY